MTVEVSPLACADCGRRVGEDGGPADGWQVEDGRTICNTCNAAELDALADVARELAARLH